MAIKDILEHSSKRRDFLRTLAAGTAAATACRTNTAVPPKGTGAIASSRASEPGRIVKDDMVYRRLGRTGLFISEICLGGSPLPDERLLFRLIERGINYLDTSESYENGNVERLTGRAFKTFGRDKIHIHARFHLIKESTEATIMESVEKSLQRLGTDHVEILGIHGVEDPADLTDERVLGAYTKLKQQGKFLFRGITCHSNQHVVIPAAVGSGLYDMIQMGYNVFDIRETEKDVKTYSDYLGESGTRKLVDLATAADVGIIAMKVLKVGGRRQELGRPIPGGPTIFQAMLKWALADAKIASVVTEILNERQMEEDLAVVGRPLTVADRRLLHAHVAANARDYCNFCGLCQAACPAGIKTAQLSRCLVYAEGYEKAERASALINGIARSGGFPACRDCGACEKACPYGLAVRDRTRRAMLV
jgi:uncharacterized protein